MVNAVTDAHIPYKEGEEHVNMCQAINEMLDDARTEGEIKGRAEGFREGRLETLKENAVNMRADGWSDETIAKILRVSVADVRIWLDSNED